MYQLSNAAVASWANAGGNALPHTIDMVCPVCRKPVAFTTGSWSESHINGLPLSIRCPRCSISTDLIRLGGSTKESVRLYIDHDQPNREPVQGLDSVPEDQIPERLRNAYMSALNVLAIGEAEATAVTCRRVLEGITSRLLPKEVKRKTLAQNIAALAEQHETLAAPLIDLSHSLRQSGNLGAHFDEDGPAPSIQDAAQMVDLLDYLLIYLYVLPQQIHQFRQDVLGQSEETTDSGD